MSEVVLKETYNGHIRKYNNWKKVKFLGINQDKNQFNIFTDGASSYKNKDVIGYAFVITDNMNNVVYVDRGQLAIGKRKKNLSALYAETIAVIKALEFIKENKINHCQIFTDSLYIVKAVKGRDCCLNPILFAFVNRIKPIISEIHYNELCVDIKYIKGHKGIIGNEVADFYAKDACKKRSKWKHINHIGKWGANS